MNTTELIEIARECGGFSHEYRPTAICFYHEDFTRFTKRIEAPHKQRIAELEKDCEILQTNYDAARQASIYTADIADQALADLKAAEKQIEQLRESLADAWNVIDRAWPTAQTDAEDTMAMQRAVESHRKVLEQTK